MKSYAEIGKMYDITKQSVRYWIKKFNIPPIKDISRYRVLRARELPDLTKSVITGGLLGDSSIEKVHTNFVFSYGHSTKQTEYALWKKHLLGWLSQADLEFTKDSTFGHPVVRMRTFSHPELAELRKSWYIKAEDKTKKVIRFSNVYKLDPLGLAIWHMDDGTKVKGIDRCCFSTCDFTPACHDILLHVLDKNFNIKGDVGTKYCHKTDKHYPYIAINTKEFANFKDIVIPYIMQVPSMMYKLQDIH